MTPGALCHAKTSLCVAPTAVGAYCNTAEAPCEAGSSCLLPLDGYSRRCLANGTPGGYCDAAGARCELGLRCTRTGSSPSRCLPTIAVGERCDQCIADGAELGLCGTAGATCGPGLRCSEGRCRIALALGDACGPYVTTGACPADSACVGSYDSSRCVADGDAGAPCRSDAPRCDAGLECSNVLSDPAQTCRRIEPIGAPCDLAARTVVCAGSAQCVPLDRAGVCTIDSAEVEPNDAAATAQVVTADPVVIAGLFEHGRRDCFAVTTVADASLLVTAPRSYGDYPAMVERVLTLLDDTGAIVATSTGTTPRFDPARNRSARGLAAGRHVVCIETSTTDDRWYRLSISVMTPAP